MATQQQIDSFYRFATERLAAGPVEMTVEDLFDRWRCEFRTADEWNDNVAAVQSAIVDMHNGDTGRDAGDIERELRESLKSL